MFRKAKQGPPLRPDDVGMFSVGFAVQECRAVPPGPDIPEETASAANQPRGNCASYTQLSRSRGRARFDIGDDLLPTCSRLSSSPPGSLVGAFCSLSITSTPDGIDETMPKHALDAENASVTSTPQPKRPRPHTSSPERDLPTISSPLSARSLSSTLWTYPTPSDSPSNPFSMKRSLVALTLPQPTRFSQHLALRFQLVYDGPRSKADRTLKNQLHNVFRIVQVPKSYTLRHIHHLVLFLFATDTCLDAPLTSKAPTKRHRSKRLIDMMRVAGEGLAGKGARREPASGIWRGRSATPDYSLTLRPAVSSAVPDGWIGHVFEVRSGIQFSGSNERPKIKPNTGRVRKRASSVRERILFRDLYDQEYAALYPEESFASSSASSDLDVVSSVDETGFEDDACGTAGWMWEAEDDYTLEKVWCGSVQLGLQEGIIYRHLPGISVQITINRTNVPVRRGRGNQPYVFKWRGSSRGAIRIAHVDARRMTSEESKESNGNLVYLTSEAFEDEVENEEERLQKWNDPNAFARFLERESVREIASRKSSAAPALGLEDSPMLPEQLETTMSPFSPSSPLISSEATLPQLSFASSASQSDYSSVSSYPSRHSSSLSLSDFFLASLPEVTPAPGNPVIARRVAQQRLHFERLAKDGLRPMLINGRRIKDDDSNNNDDADNKDEKGVSDLKLLRKSPGIVRNDEEGEEAKDCSPLKRGARYLKRGRIENRNLGSEQEI
ncbi:uncharacterized protein LAESUDRAFT_750932 [Laetiporus sulphureus 93-53]|uniref:Uncharacterized protein n=1 Tax=Laetiporus sulphureus 93-53 TaxID=1314785 RepID=A0A165DF43_9APHY|nr:uncharacterized protein LAESUDRAFT_750932 [Laetiporus sulphureus 93-53]KZT04753.1 hypothetical protein LAESUDRAFT_750932 [Laetiporus sulphureus 93-53]